MKLDITECQICHKPAELRMVDGATHPRGQWAYCCEDCHRAIGYGIGFGRGQLWERKSLDSDEWELIRGGPTAEDKLMDELEPHVCHGCGAAVVLDCDDEDAPPAEQIFCAACIAQDNEEAEEEAEDWK